MPTHHDVRQADVNQRRLGAVLALPSQGQHEHERKGEPRKRIEDVEDVKDVKDSGSPRLSGWPERWDR